MNDLLVCFDTKTGEKMKNQDKFIEEVRKIANKYDFDFWMAGNPEQIKQTLSYVDFESEE